MTVPGRDLVWDLQNASAGYGSKQVLFDLNLQQRSGEFVCLLGHNGAGKSTLLKVLYGLLRPRSGRVFHCGDDITQAGLAARLQTGIAYMPGGRGVFQQLTVAENFRLGLAAAQIPNAQRV